MVHETSEINYYMNEPFPKPRLHTVTARVDRVLFPDGSELESSDQLLTTEDLTTLAAQLANGLTVTQIAGGASYTPQSEHDALKVKVGTLEAATNTPQSAHDALKVRVETLEGETNTPQSEHDTLEGRVGTLEAATHTPQSEHDTLKGRVDTLEVTLIAHGAILRASTQLISAHMEVSFQEGLKVTALEAQTIATTAVGIATAAALTAQQELDDKTQQDQVGYEEVDYFPPTNTYFKVQVQDAPGENVDTFDEYTISTWTGGEPNFDANLLVFINSPEIKLFFEGTNVVTLAPGHFDELRQGHKDAVRIDNGGEGVFTDHYFLGPKLSRDGKVLVYDYALFSIVESGDFYKVIDTSAEETAVEETALALTEATGDKVTADTAVVDAQSAIDAARDLATEIESDQSQALVVLNWVNGSVSGGAVVTDSSGVTDLPSVTPDDSITII
jgi:hypothetical protein